MKKANNTSRQFWRYTALLVGLLGLCLSLGSVVVAQEAPASEAAAIDPGEGTSTEVGPEETVAEEAAADLGVGYAFDNAMLFFAAVLVFFMQAGFAMVEAGFNAQKNAVNILFKNSMDICIGVLLFFIVGFGLMYPGYYGVDVKESPTLPSVALGSMERTRSSTIRLARKLVGCSKPSLPRLLRRSSPEVCGPDEGDRLPGL
jgi:hypothetical protein